MDKPNLQDDSEKFASSSDNSDFYSVNGGAGFDSRHWHYFIHSAHFLRFPLFPDKCQDTLTYAASSFQIVIQFIKDYKRIIRYYAY
jgi:hypothetical protein